MQFQMLRQRSVPQERIEALAHALNEIPGIQIPDDALNRYPSFPMAVLNKREALAQFFTAIESFVAALKP
jgi:hypothetical protein